ncbi:exopolyphosphatase [Acanthopleuribacter pedis]|uniref:Exopolyphosphatase n=1 Tax=Acanthopleuribacter pedis TaxID=442870 RepID=A0A8J7QKX3_9BACT|nr:exopolyphosphatase [Acanthopleuribacter pedis]MBO1322961.1 exopolyphosphatase [Acanthopleuribacter pedis]
MNTDAQAEKKKYRLVTRSDFDGLVCAVLFKELDMINEIMFVHPKDMQDGKIDVNAGDITTNLPYVPGCYLAFDHHYSETLRTPLAERKNHVIDPNAPSAARVVYNYYGGLDTFPRIGEDLMEAVDKADSADFEREDILNPRGWVLLSFLMDARTGLGRFRKFRISNYQLMMDLIDYCKDHTIDDILALPDVKERMDMFFSHERKFDEQIKRCATMHDSVVVLDLRDEEVIYTGNRFKIYALFPESEVSIHVMWGLRRQNTVFAVGKSIFNRNHPVNIGELMLTYGGGGHHAAGTCQVANELADATLQKIIKEIIEAKQN